MPRYANTAAYSEAENQLWERLSEMQGVVFHTAKGLPFTYEIRGNEIFFSRKEKSVTRATVNKAYHRMMEETITGSKQLSVFGASYLYPILKNMGLGTGGDGSNCPRRRTRPAPETR